MGAGVTVADTHSFDGFGRFLGMVLSDSEVRSRTSTGKKEVGVWAGDRKVWGKKYGGNIF